MRKSGMTICYSIMIPVLMALSCGRNNITTLIQVKKIINYPSASGIEYLNGQLFIIGDDANNILVLDTSLNVKDSISLYSYPGQRIPKTIKADLEAIAAYKDNTVSVLFLFGSGSLSPYRNTGWLYNLQTKNKNSLSLEALYSQIKHTGINEINIEGACFIPGFLILANRGNKAYPMNHLIFTEEKFREKEKDYSITTVPVGHHNDSSTFSGVSGLAYATQNDWLILTVSTEDTRSSFEDGAIGKSYLWIVKNISFKKNQQSISPDRVIDLESIDRRFKGQKIESACITGETKNLISLVLVADNDDGSSNIFRMNLVKD